MSESSVGTSLGVQWLRIHVPTQGSQVQSLVREDPTHSSLIIKKVDPNKLSDLLLHMPQYI